MTDRIDRVRLLIADQPGAGAVFTDQEIQAALDARQVEEGIYDVYATAADLLEAWAAREKLSFDVDADGARFKRSQKAAMLLELAQTYRRQQRPSIIQQVRDDVVV